MELSSILTAVIGVVGSGVMMLLVNRINRRETIKDKHFDINHAAELKEREDFRDSVASWILNLQNQLDALGVENLNLRKENIRLYDENLAMKAQIFDLKVRIMDLEKEVGNGRAGNKKDIK